MKAIWNGKVIAESNDIVNVENNPYFPMSSINKDYLISSDTKSVCPWKGKASYYSLEVDGKKNIDAVWYYPEPSEAAKSIKDRVAFWKGVQIV
ncbi:MAG TPA: DUF427 domain-containing protein [Williamwhitmania sp.]|nr:DUF427 domain-containing protein [Williamwhitmania sp.]